MSPASRAERSPGAQAVAEGWSHDRVDRRLAAGQWLVVCGEGLAVRGSVTPATRAWAAHLTRPDAVISHLTAAELHRFPAPPSDVVHITGETLRHRIRGARVHRLCLPRSDVVQLERGLLVTSRRRTAIDCLRLLSKDDALQLFAWLSTREVLSRDALADEIAATRGRWGTPKLIRVFDETRGGALSRPERLVHELLQGAGVTGWVANAPIVVAGRRIAVADILFEREKVIVEIDGYSAHSGRKAFVDDRRRQNLLLGAGYLVLRFTWDDVTQNPDEVLRQIAQALSGRR